MKTFNDLEFKKIENENRFQAKLTFENGYGVSVLLGGYGIYSNGVDTYEVAVLHNGELCYDTHITSDVLAYQTKEETDEIIKQIQLLNKKIDVKDVCKMFNREFILSQKEMTFNFEINENKVYTKIEYTHNIDALKYYNWTIQITTPNEFTMSYKSNYCSINDSEYHFMRIYEIMANNLKELKNL
jgi:hypothetical protein